MDEWVGGHSSTQSGGQVKAPGASSIVNPTTHGAPSCDVCGRRDESLRAIVIPYVYSLLIITMRRAWTGVYCWRHRVQRLLAAGVISSLAGWWGIPWGLIYTPITLLKLVKGGEVPEDENVELLARIAVHKLNTGEPEDAFKTFKEALRIKEDERTRNSLLQLQAKYPLYSEVKESSIPYWYVGSFLGATILGMSLGIADYLVALLLGWIIGSEAHWLLAILTWAPFIAMIVVGALLLDEILRWVFDRTGTDHLLMGIIVALGVGGLVWYGIPQGFLMGDYFHAIMTGLHFDSVGDFIMTTGAVFSQGGLWFILDGFGSGIPGDVIYMILWSVAGLLYGWIALRAAQESVHWQVRLELLQGDLRQEDQRSQLPVWGSIAGAAFIFLLGLAIFAGRGRLLRGGPDLVAAIERGDELYLAGEYELAEQAYRQAIDTAPARPDPHESLGWTLYNLGRIEEAAVEFSSATELDPAWADPHIGMAYIHLSVGESEAAEVEFQTAMNLADEPYALSQAYYGLGNLAHQRDDLNSALAYYQQAVREDWQLAIAHMDMSIAYYAMGEYERAVEHATDIMGISPDWGAPHALLALANYQLDRQEAMERELDWAEELNSEDLYSQLLLADVYWSLEQYDPAEAVLRSAHLLFPENAQIYLLMARLMALQGDFAEADAWIDRQQALYPVSADSLIARARVRIEAQDLTAAEAALDEALNLSPGNWEVYNLRGFVYFHQGRIDEAYAAADTAIRSYPYEGSSYVYRAFAARAQGSIENAFADAHQAIELAPKLDVAHFILGVLHFDRGDPEAGAASLRTFLELARDRAYVRDYVQQAKAVLDQIP